MLDQNGVNKELDEAEQATDHIEDNVLDAETIGALALCIEMNLRYILGKCDE